MDAKLFIELFQGRVDAYGCNQACVKEPLTISLINDHLNGYKRIGRYPLSPDILDGSGTWWIAADIDIEEPGYATILAEAIEHLGIPCYVERSKSKGYHVWVFFSESIEAKWARALMLYGIEVLEKDTGYRGGGEMFPKQNTIRHPNGTFLKPDGTPMYGNYINLPMFGADVPKGKTVFLNALDHYNPYPDQWECLRLIKRVDPQQIIDLTEIGELVEAPELLPQKERLVQNPTELGLTGMLAEMMLKCAFCREFMPNSGEMHEELWYCWLTQMVCFEGGAELAHKFSSGSPKYNDETTRKKIEHAKDAKANGLAPYTCTKIIGCQGWISTECEKCYAHPRRRNSSPAGLPYILKSLETERWRVATSPNPIANDTHIAIEPVNENSVSAPKKVYFLRDSAPKSVGHVRFSRTRDRSDFPIVSRFSGRYSDESEFSSRFYRDPRRAEPNAELPMSLWRKQTCRTLRQLTAKITANIRIFTLLFPKSPGEDFLQISAQLIRILPKRQMNFSLPV